MNYRKPKEVFLGEKGLQRTYLLPIPGVPGHWMLAHPSVRVSCPRCGSESFEPCASSRGRVVLTGAQAQTLLDYIDGQHVHPSTISKAICVLREAKFYRKDPHEERRHKWRHRGYAHPPGPSDKRKAIAKLWRHVRWLKDETRDQRMLRAVTNVETLLRKVLERKDPSL